MLIKGFEIMDIEILHKDDVGEPTRPYDFSIDQDSTIGKIFVLNKDIGTINFEECFKEQILDKNSATKMHLKFMITAYKEFGRLRLFCGDITQKCYGEVIKEWLTDELLELRKACNIYLPRMSMND